MAAPCFPAQLKDFPFTPEEVRDIWDHAKSEYLDKGIGLTDAIHGVAGDLGLKPEWVAKAFTMPKGARRLSDQAYKSMADRRRVVQEAKDYVRSIDTPGYKKLIKGVMNAPFSVAVFGHGTVGMQTHAGARLFNPSSWNSYFSNFFRQFKFMNTATHEAAMQHLVHDPGYIPAKRAGLAVDPARSYTDYEVYGKFFGKTAIRPIKAALEMGQRGFDVLKVYRLEQWKSEMSGLSAELKADPEVGKAVAEMINHSTGVSDIGHGTLATAANKLLFAAKLEGSRWARILGDPIKTVDTFANWKQASAGDRTVALKRLRRAAEFTAFYYTTLLANNAILAATGSKSRVNLTDPTKSDWLRHRIGDKTLGLEGSLLQPVRFLARIGYDLWGPRSKFQQGTHESRFSSLGGHAVDYLRGKLAPFPSIATDIATGADYSGRPLPLPNATTPRKGVQPYTATEYALQHGPIPLSGASREVYDAMRERGMPAVDAVTLLKGLPILGAEMTGAKVGKPSDAYKQEKNKAHVAGTGRP